MSDDKINVVITVQFHADDETVSITLGHMQFEDVEAVLDQVSSDEFKLSLLAGVSQALEERMKEGQQ